MPRHAILSFAQGDSVFLGFGVLFGRRESAIYPWRQGCAVYDQYSSPCCSFFLHFWRHKRYTITAHPRILGQYPFRFPADRKFNNSSTEGSRCSTHLPMPPP
jgi:hypothetical protein